jgi:hypothetical protein
MGWFRHTLLNPVVATHIFVCEFLCVCVRNVLEATQLLADQLLPA